MKIAVMQPYLFPYIGYFQLMNRVDHFIFYDDVQFIHRGWINRNRILINNSAHLFTFSLKQEGAHLNISDQIFSPLFESEKKKFMKTLAYAYKKAPYFLETKDLIERILTVADNNVASFIMNSLISICRYLQVDHLTFSRSSDYEENNKLSGYERIIDLCHRAGGTHYINSIGGQHLYSKSVFADKGIQLNFLQTNPISYRQYNVEFVPALSIIDVLMFNSKEHVRGLLQECELV